MPLFKIINHDSTTQILIWKITESLSQLSKQVILQTSNQLRINNMKSEIHQRAFLSVRMLLYQLNYSDSDLIYDSFGKPHLADNQFISISHSHEFSTIIVSNKIVGIDIEMQREKIIKIADKFSSELIDKSVKQNYIRKLTILWGAKEAIFKIKNIKGISFKDHIFVKPINLDQNNTQAELIFNEISDTFDICFYEIENYILVYAL